MRWGHEDPRIGRTAARWTQVEQATKVYHTKEKLLALANQLGETGQEHVVGLHQCLEEDKHKMGSLLDTVH